MRRLIQPQTYWEASALSALLPADFAKTSPRAVMAAKRIRNATTAILWEKHAAVTMKMQPAMAAAGAT